MTTQTPEAAPDDRQPTTGGDADFWGRGAPPRWLGVVALALVVAVVPLGAVNGTPGAVAGARRPDGPSRRDAVAVAAPHSVAVAQATDRVNAARAAVDQAQQQLVVVHLAAYEDNTRVLPIAASDSLARVRSSRYADVAVRALTIRALDAQHALGVAEHQQEQALADYFAGLAAAAVAEEAAHAAAGHVASGTAVVSAAPSTGTCAGALACFLACTRAHESDTAGGYQAVSPDGVYHGAYQFDQGTWNSVAGSVGRADLVGVDPATASSADQDTLATALYEMRGNQPWGGRC